MIQNLFQKHMNHTFPLMEATVMLLRHGKIIVKPSEVAKAFRRKVKTPWGVPKERSFVIF